MGFADHSTYRGPRFGPVQAEVQHQAGVGEAVAQSRESDGQVVPQGVAVRQRVGERAQGGQGGHDRAAPAHPVKGRARAAARYGGSVGEPGPGTRVEDQVDGGGQGSGEVEVQFLGDADEGAQALAPHLGGGPDVGARGPQLGRVGGQQGLEHGVPVVAGQGVQPVLGGLEGPGLGAQHGQRLGAGLLDGRRQQCGGLEGADSGGRVERLGGLRTPGRRALLPHQRGEPDEPVGGDALPQDVLAVEGEAGNGSEGSGRVVVQGEPAGRVASAVAAVVGEDHDGTGSLAQHVAEAVDGLGASGPSGGGRVEGLDEFHPADRARRVGQRAGGEGFQQDEEAGSVPGGGGLRRGPVGQFRQSVEEVRPGQVLSGHRVRVALPAVHRGEGDLSRNGRAERRLPAEDVVDGEDLPDRRPPVSASPPRPAHPLGAPGGGLPQGRVVAVLGLVVEEHALGACAVLGRDRPRGGGRLQVPGDRYGAVHGGPHECGDARAEPCVGHLGQHPGDGLLGQLA